MSKNGFNKEESLSSYIQQVQSTVDACDATLNMLYGIMYSDRIQYLAKMLHCWVNDVDEEVNSVEVNA